MDNEMILEKANQLADYLSVNVEEIETPNDDDCNLPFSTPNGEYLVVTEDEAEKELEDYICQLIDQEGMSALNDKFKEELIQNHLNLNELRSIVTENLHEYLNTLPVEDFLKECKVYSLISSKEYNEMTKLEDSDLSQVVERLNDKLFDAILGDGDDYKKYTNYVYLHMGEDVMSILIETNAALLDYKSIAEACRERDGYGAIFTPCDGVTNRTEDFYVFKISNEDTRSKDFLKARSSMKFERE